MTEFKTGAVRDTGGKGRMDLLPWSALIRVSKHIEDSLTHYPERNWEKGIPMHSMIDSAFRHLAKYMDGAKDEDHLCAAATNLLMALWTEEHKPELMDIPTRLTQSKVGSCYSIPTAEIMLCSCYDAINKRCKGTKEQDPCSCGGNKNNCTYH